MHLATKAPSIFLVVIVVLAVALLVTGFGAQVGIGVIVGALLGIAWIVALLAMNPRTSGGARYWASDGGSSKQPDQELLQRHHRDSMRVAGVDAGALLRVIPVGRMIEAKGVRLELVAVELREDGGIATVVGHTRPPIGMLGHFVEVSVSDDLDTAYAASGQGSGGSNLGTARYEVRFAPAPPGNARRLTLRISSFASPFGMEAAEVAGPWEFHVEV